MLRIVVAATSCVKGISCAGPASLIPGKVLPVVSGMVDPGGTALEPPESTVIMGDVDVSGTVDEDYLSLLLAHWNEGTPPTGAPIPEPASALILLLGLACAARRRMRR